MVKQLTNKTLARNSVFNLIYNILNLLFPLITSMYVSRILYPAGVGRVAYAQNITSYFITFATLGLPTYGVREIAKARTNDYSVNRTFTELLIVSWISTSVATVAFLAVVFSPSMEDKRVLMLCCGVQLFFNFINIDWLYQGLEEYVYIVCRSISIKVISIVCIFLFVRQKEDYILYALISSVALAGNYLFNICHARKYVRFDFKGFQIKRHIKPLLILGAAVFFSTIYSKLDITMLGAMHSERETGLYSNAFRLVAIASSVSASISAVFLPRLSYYYNSDRDSFQNLIQFGIRVISFFAFPIVAGLIILAPGAVQILFGKEFIDAVPTIRILAILVLIKSFGDLLCYQLAIATGHEKERLLAYALAALLNICLNYLLIPVMGRNGAAIASVFSELLLNAIQFFKMKKIIGYHIGARPIVLGIATTAFMAVSMLAVMHVTMHILLQSVVAAFVGVICYIGLNWVLYNEILRSIVRKDI